MVRKILLIALFIMLLAQAAFARTGEVSLNATGYDWLGFSQDDKCTFTGLLYIVLGGAKNKYKAEDVIKMLNDFYYTAIKEAKADPLRVDEDYFLKIRCVDVISRQLNYKDELMNERR